jgi:hypothetical protein
VNIIALARLSALHTEIAANDPLFACSYFTALVKEAVFAVAVEERHSHLQLRYYRGRRRLALAWRFSVEDCLAADAASSRR